MTVDSLCNTLGLPLPQQFSKDDAPDLEQLFALVDRCDGTGFQAAIDSRFELAYALLMQRAIDAHEQYRQKGIPDDVYYATMHDFKIWFDVCESRYARAGIAESNWLVRHVNLAIFQLGRLQFEPSSLKRGLVIDGTTYEKGTPVINVHIPEGEPLLHECVAESFGLSKKFFPQVLKLDANLYHCDSWLLAKENEHYVCPESNIRAFAGWFSCYHESYHERQAEERVFDWEIMHPELYPERTSLQKSLKSFLLSGGAVGLGYGVSFGQADDYGHKHEVTMLE